MTTATQIPLALLRTVAPSAGYDDFGVIFAAPNGSALPLKAQHLYYREQGPGTLHDLLDPGGLTTTASVITAVADATLVSSRVLGAGTGIAVADGGPQGTITVSLSPATAALVAALASGRIVVQNLTPGIPESRVLTAGAGITLTDGGAQGPLTVAQSLPVTSTSATISFVATPVPASVGNSGNFNQVWTFVKVGTVVYATVRSVSFNGGTLGFTSITGSGIPAGYRPAVSTVCPQGSLIGVASVPGISAFFVTAAGDVGTAWTTSGSWPIGPGSGWTDAVIQWSTV